MQPYFLPYIGYFQTIAAVERYILYGNLSFIKEAWMNRNRISLKNSSEMLITVPLQEKSSNKLINEIRIDNKQKWKSKLFKSIVLNYKGSVGFDETFDLLESIFAPFYESLYDLNTETIIAIANFLDISTEISTENNKYNEMEMNLMLWEQGHHDVFPELRKTVPVKKVARVLQMCRMENSDYFVNAIGGQELYNKDEFALYNVALKFVKTNEIIYQQFNDMFIPNLSIIDVLMHTGKAGAKKLLKEYTLI